MNERKLANYKRLTKKELKELFQPYRQAFPDWEVSHDVKLTRRSGPIEQYMFLYGMSYAAYRPEHGINLLLNIPDGCSFLQRDLDIKHRVIERRAHPRMWPRVIEAMEGQFLPPIREPLDVTETLRLAEEEVERDRIANINHFTGLAALNAHLGHVDRALQWCDRIVALSEGLGRPLAEWETRKRDYALGLKDAIEAGEVGVFLASAGDVS